MPKRLSDSDYQKIMNSPDIQRVLDVKADQVRDVARRRIKHVTGETADSVVVVEATRDDGVQVRRVGYDLDIAESGPYYEFGTEDTAPHPTLRTAGKAVRGKR